MRIEQIKHFIKTVDTLSITKAAEELYITQSVLSKQIAGMEHELNVTLFERSKAGIRLTPVGVVAYECFSKVLQSYESAIHHIRDYQTNVAGTLYFSKLSGLKAPETLINGIEEFRRRYPNVTVLRKNQNNGPMTVSMRDGKHDVYLTWQHCVCDNPNMEFVPLARFKVSLAVSSAHSLAGVENPGIDMLRNVSWITILEEEAYSLNRLISKITKNAGFEPHMIYAENLSDMIDLIQDGTGVGVVCEGHILHGASSMHFMDFPEIPGWTMVVASRKDNKNPMAAEFLSVLGKNAAAGDPAPLRQGDAL